NPGSSLTIDDSSAPLDRIANAATITLTNGTFANPTALNYIGNSAGSSETYAATTLSANDYSIIRSTTTAGGAVSVTTSGTFTPGAGAFATFIAGNPALGTTNNKLIYTGLGGTVPAPTLVPYATVVSAGGTASAAKHDTTFGIAALTTGIGTN